MASRVSTTRETVARVMSDLARKGLVKRKGNTLEIGDLEMLQDMVEEFRGD
jgi:predicted transcriptional regulator